MPATIGSKASFISNLINIAPTLLVTILFGTIPTTENNATLTIITKNIEVFEGEAEPTKFEAWCSKKFNINLMSVVMWFAVILGLALAIGLFFLQS